MQRTRRRHYRYASAPNDLVNLLLFVVLFAVMFATVYVVMHHPLAIQLSSKLFSLKSLRG